MGSPKPKTKFEPVPLNAAIGWYVRVTLPHGEEIQINEFPTWADARVWIAEKSAAWLKKFRGGRYV
jgi:hypothetical protein